MKRTRALALLLTGGMFLPALVRPITATTPYDGITARNSFALLPPTPAVPDVPPPPPANIKLTGISTWGGTKKAMLMVQDTSGPGKPDISVILPEGQRQSGVEVIEINEAASYVKVKNNDLVSTLTFDANGAKPAAPGAPPQMPPQQILNPPRPGVPNPTMTSIEQPRPRGGLRQIPSRTLRLPQNNNGNMGGNMGGSMGVPVNSMGSSAGGQPPTSPQENNNGLSPEDQLVLMHAKQIMDQPEVDKGNIPPPPPLPPMPDQQPQ